MLSSQHLNYLRWGLRGGSLLLVGLLILRLLVSYGTSIPGWYLSGFGSGSASPEIEIRLFLMPMLQLICLLLVLIHWALWENLWCQGGKGDSPPPKQKKAVPVSSAWDP